MHARSLPPTERASATSGQSIGKCELSTALERLPPLIEGLQEATKAKEAAEAAKDPSSVFHGLNVGYDFFCVLVIYLIDG